MIREYAADLAAQMGMQLSDISVVDGEQAGCIGVHLLLLSINDNMVSSLVYQTDIAALQDGSEFDRLETRIRSALSRLQMMVAE